MITITANQFDPELRREITSKFITAPNPADFSNCLTCGVCSAGCPFNGLHEDMDPRKFIRKILLGLRDDALNSKFLWNCTMCERCTMDCPMNVNIAGLVRTVRGMRAGEGKIAPGFLQDVVEAQLKTGNQMEVTREDYLETLDWMSEELVSEVGDPNAAIVVDKEGADYLFFWDPREIKYYPQDILSIAKIFWAAGANWTCSSKWWDGTHYALFSGDDETSRVLVQRTMDEYIRLKAKMVVVTECGHAMRAQRWGRKVWLGADYPVYSILELIAGWIKEGRFKLDPTRNQEPVTLHDPCNLVRKEGLVEVPRYVIRHAVTEFREMWPNGRYNYCCGGGGGALAFGDEYRPSRMEKGRLKAEQINRTGAKIVLSPCHNCFDALDDIIRYYKMDVKVKHIHHMVSNALIIPGQEQD